MPPLVTRVPQVENENAARAVQGQVPTPGYLPREVPTCLGTQPPEYLPPWVPTLGGWVPREVGMCGVVRGSPSCAVRGGVLVAFSFPLVFAGVRTLEPL